MIKIENAADRYYIPYSASNAEILASAGTVSGSNQSIELYTLKWTAQTNTITLTGTKEGCTPNGGKKGQVLVKKSNESFDTEWLNALPYVPVGGVIEWDGSGLTGAPDLTTPEKVATFYGYGTWERYAIDRVTVGAGGNYPAGSVGGEKEHTLTVDEIARHRHEGIEWASNENIGLNIGTNASIQLQFNPANCTNGIRTAYSGGNQPHNNMQPYVALYKYRRIA